MTETLEATLRNPTPTADKRIRGFAARMHTLPRRRTAPLPEVPGLDVPTLQRKYDPTNAHLPRPHMATFRVPVGCSPSHLLALKKAAFLRLVQALNAQGWEPVVDSQHPPQDGPGVYPARDLDTNIPLLDQREWLLRVWFRFRNPQPVRIDLTPQDVAPTRLTA